MPINSQLLDEIKVLSMFDVSSHQNGIKVHSQADPAIIAAAERLYHKQLITQADGGYLTPLGYEAAVHWQNAVQILNSRIN